MKPGIHEPRARRWVIGWKGLFWSLLIVDLSAFGFIPIIDKHEAIGYGFAVVAFGLGILFAIASFVVARYVGRYGLPWAICGLISTFPGPAQLAFGVIGFTAIRRALHGPVFRSRLRIRIQYAAAIALVVAETCFLGGGHLVYELGKNAKPLSLGIHASRERVLNTAQVVFQEAGYTIEDSKYPGIVHAREPTRPTRYYEITTLGSRGELEQLYAIRMDSKRFFFSIPMEGGNEMLPIPKEALLLFNQVKTRAERKEKPVPGTEGTR